VRQTKILMTIGPASMDKLDLLLSKVEGVRMNFSHGDHAGHLREIKAVREISKDLPLMLDTAGPEIRITEALKVGKEPVSLKKLKTSVPLSVCGSDTLIVDDGKFRVHVLEDGLVCQKEGTLRRGAKVICHGKDINLPTLTKRDIADIKFGVNEGIDMVALSFVRTPEDVIETNTLLRDLGAEDVAVIVKIEHWKALENLREIIRLSDGVMVARGDLAVEVPYQQVPTLQKKLVKMALEMRRPTIVATQMLHSMMTCPTPTRAELSDIANAVLDGADAVMLSGETSLGQYPVEAVEVMNTMVQEAEKEVRMNLPPRTITEELALSAKTIAEKMGAQLFCETNTGRTARRIAKFRPSVPIYVKTPTPRRARQLRLLWGVQQGLPDKGYVVHVEHLADHPGIKVEYKGPVLARGETYGTGMVVGVVGKGVVRLDGRNKQLPEQALGVLYYGKENDPLLQGCIRKGIPAIIPNQQVENGVPVIVDFDFGMVIQNDNYRYESLLNRFPQLRGPRYPSF